MLWSIKLRIQSTLLFVMCDQYWPTKTLVRAGIWVRDSHAGGANFPSQLDSFEPVMGKIICLQITFKSNHLHIFHIQIKSNHSIFSKNYIQIKSNHWLFTFKSNQIISFWKIALKSFKIIGTVENLFKSFNFEYNDIN